MIYVLIPTYNRPNLLKKLLSNLRKQAKGYDVEYLVLEDAGKGEDIIGADYFHIKSKHHYGKKEFWKVINGLFQMVLWRERIDYVIMIADDMQICDNFFDRAIEQYEGIKDDKKICLSLFMPKGRENKANWTCVKSTLVEFGQNKYYHTQWNDLCFIAKKDFLQALNFKINPIDKRRWDNAPLISSGVGQQISNRLHSLGYNMYHCFKNLVSHGTHPSMMNPVERKLNPLI